jgi:hypothetical protein
MKLKKNNNKKKRTFCPYSFCGRLYCSAVKNHIETKLYFIIKSNVLAEIESNRMQIKSNNFIDFSKHSESIFFF